MLQETIHKLRLYIHQLFPENLLQDDKPISLYFEQGLFRENFQSLADYISEAEDTLESLSQLENDQVEACQFLVSKLLKQCQTLQQELYNKSETEIKNTLNLKSKREQLKQNIIELPPRERLSKYYEALRALNDKIEHQQDKLLQAPPEEKAIWINSIQLTNQRKEKCLEAIDMLEEYLLLVGQENLLG